MKEYADYIGNEHLGILMQTEGKPPMLVVSQTIGIETLIDNRIVGQWTFGDGLVNLDIRNDGTVTTTTPSGKVRSAIYEWYNGQILAVFYGDQHFDILNFHMIDPDWAYVTIVSDDSDVPISFVAQRYTGDSQSSGLLTFNGRLLRPRL